MEMHSVLVALRAGNPVEGPSMGSFGDLILRQPEQSV